MREIAAVAPPDRLEGEQVVLRRAAATDLAELLPIANTPEVRHWWGPQDDLGEQIVRAEVPMYAILVGGAVTGMIQYYEEHDPQYRHAGMDLYLAPWVHGQGYGTDAVRTMARWLVTGGRHHRLIIDPDAENHAAIRCYTRVGFKPVGILRRYARVHTDGDWRDGLLMDALAEEILAADPAPPAGRGPAPAAG